MISNTVTSAMKLHTEVRASGNVLPVVNIYPSGIVSGLEVSSQDSLLTITSGQFFLDGTLFDVPKGITGLLVSPMTVGNAGFVVLSKYEELTYGYDPFNVQRVTGTTPKFEVLLVPEVTSKTQIVLAHFEVIEHYYEDDSGEPVMVQAHGSLVSTIPAAGPFVIQTHRTGLDNVVVTNANTSVVFDYTLTYPVNNQYRVDSAMGLLYFSTYDAGVLVAIEYDYLIPKQSVEVKLSTDKRRYENVRPMFTVIDTKHSVNSKPLTNNPHGTTFSDVERDFPIHAQIFDTGYAVMPNDRDNILGVLSTAVFKPFPYLDGLTTKYRFSLDTFGEITGTVGRQYVRLPHVPLSVLYVTVVDLGTPVFFEVINDVVAFADQAFDFNSIQVNYTYASDYEYNKLADNAVVFKKQNDAVIITEGLELLDGPELRVDMKAYSKTPCDITVSVNAQGQAVLTPTILDYAKVSDKPSSNYTSPKVLHGSSQISLSLRNSPLANSLLPPAGRLLLASNKSTVYGTRRFIYTYSTQAQVLYTTVNTGTPLPNAYNLNQAKLYRNSELLDDDSWRLIDGNKVVISSDVYEADLTASYRLVSNESTSARNRRDYFEVIGTAAKASGPLASCNVTQLYDALSDGDTFTLVTNKYSVTKTFRKFGRFYGVTLASVAESLQQSFLQDELVIASNIEVTVVGNKVVFTSASNLSVLSATSENACFKVIDFQQVGSNYIAELTVLSTNFVEQDSVVLNVDGSSPAVTRHWLGYDEFQQLDYTPLEAIKAAFLSDAKIVDSKTMFYVLGTLMVITSGDAGVLGNSNSFSYSTKRVVVSATDFTGGLDTSPSSFADISGLQLTLVDEQAYDSSGVFRIYATDNIATGASETLYKQVAEVSQVANQNTYDILLNSNNFDENSVIDTSSEFSLSVMLVGKDASGASISETIIITPMNFCEFVDVNTKLSELLFVRSKLIYSEISQYVVTQQQAIGKSELVLLAEVTSGSRDLFELAVIHYDGKAVKSIEDRRKFISSTTHTDPSVNIGEAMSAVFNLLGIVQ